MQKRLGNGLLPAWIVFETSLAAQEPELLWLLVAKTIKNLDVNVMVFCNCLCVKMWLLTSLSSNQYSLEPIHINDKSDIRLFNALKSGVPVVNASSSS